MTIGILGGMGSLAAADFFSAMVRAFPAEKEWDRPRIVVDNACHMPSRVRALLYGERQEELIHQLAEHMAGLVGLGCTDIVLCCTTSHVFLPQVLPLARELAHGADFTLRHIIRILGEDLQGAGAKRVSLIATEGTIDAKVYPQILSEYGIGVECEGEAAFAELRFLIEAVKQDQMGDEAIGRFLALVNRQACPDVVLGCTEFPLLRARLGARESELKVRLHDPLLSTIHALQRDYDAR
jgi:aspartate racemase